MMTRGFRSFMGTVPTSYFYGLVESVRLIEEEGLDNVVARHHRLAEAARLAVRTWAGNDGPQLYCLNPTRYSDSVTAVMMPDGHDAEVLRKTALDRFNVSMGGGLGAARRQGVPDRASWRPQRADGPRHACRGRDEPQGQQRPAWEGRRRRSDGVPRRLTRS